MKRMLTETDAFTWQLPTRFWQVSRLPNPPHVADGQMDHCNHCNQELIEIDNRGEGLTGCLSCNLWSASDESLWISLSDQDLHALALHSLRHGGAAKQMPKPHRSS